MMVAVSTSETSNNFYETTRRNISEDSDLHTHRRENLKYHMQNICICAFLIPVVDWGGGVRSAISRRPTRLKHILLRVLEIGSQGWADPINRENSGRERERERDGWITKFTHEHLGTLADDTYLHQRLSVHYGAH
jgi:hypothetical protein